MRKQDKYGLVLTSITVALSSYILYRNITKKQDCTPSQIEEIVKESIPKNTEQDKDKNQRGYLEILIPEN